MTDAPGRRRPMTRIGDLIPTAAAELGLAEELRRAQAAATFDAIVAELAPAAHGSCRAIRISGTSLVVEADAPIVAQELRLRSSALVAAFRQASQGGRATGAVLELRVTVRSR